MDEVMQPLEKKQRIETDRPHDNSSNQQLDVESCFLYLDAIPENSLNNIVRFRSRSPNAVNWPNHTWLEDIHDLYDAPGELGKFVHGRFTGVYVSSGCHRWVDSRLDKIGVASEGILLCTPAFLSVFIQAGRVIPSFESLFVGYLSPGDKNLLGNHNLGSLSKQWPNIRHLLFREASVRNWKWFETFGKDLEFLDVHGARVGTPIKLSMVVYCTKLRHLDLQEGIWEGEVIDPAMFWSRVGKHLETISARFHQSDEGHTDNIMKYCRNIKRLELSGDNDGNAKCIAFYGERIEEAKMDTLREGDLKLLSSSCPNARFSLNPSSKSGLRMALGILGPQLKVLDIRYIGYGEQADELSPDWSSCTLLESVRYRRGLRIEDMRCLLANPKSLLKSIEFTGRAKVFKEEEQKELSSLFSRGTGALEKLDLCLHDTSLVLLKSLVGSNRNLSNVRIRIFRQLDDGKKMDVLETFLKCPSLQRLFLADSRRRGFDALDVAEGLGRSLRYRRIWICAFGKMLVSGGVRPRWSSVY